jgi:WD40 repeat protein
MTAYFCPLLLSLSLLASDRVPAPGKLRLRHGGFVSGVVFTPDGKALLTASGDGVIRVWDPATGKELRRLGEHKGGVLALALTRDGRTLASGGADRAARLWDVRAGKELRRLRRQPTDVSAVALSPDGGLLALAHPDSPGEYLRSRTTPEFR